VNTYYQEYYLHEAEDEAKVIGFSAVGSVDYGDFSNCLQTLETYGPGI